jgi:hypothetical protein
MGIHRFELPKFEGRKQVARQRLHRCSCSTRPTYDKVGYIYTYVQCGWIRHPARPLGQEWSNSEWRPSGAQTTLHLHSGPNWWIFRSIPAPCRWRLSRVRDCQRPEPKGFSGHHARGHGHSLGFRCPYLIAAGCRLRAECIEHPDCVHGSTSHEPRATAPRSEAHLWPWPSLWSSAVPGGGGALKNSARARSCLAGRPCIEIGGASPPHIVEAVEHDPLSHLDEELPRYRLRRCSFRRFRCLRHAMGILRFELSKFGVNKTFCGWWLF